VGGKNKLEPIALDVPQDVLFASEGNVGRLIFIDALSAAVLLVIWYCIFAHYNRRRGVLALRRVQAACCHEGQITEAQWFGVSRLQARLAFAAHWFENARIVIRLRPRAIPLKWLFSLWHRQKETLTFEADLDYAPSFQLEVFRHRWVSKQHARVAATSPQWTVSRPGPVVLTTRTYWTHEMTPVVNALITSRGHNLLSVRFRPRSPHLAATISLEALADEQAAAAFLTVLRELAAGASAHQ
jgi:hypothetical protein